MLTQIRWSAHLHILNKTKSPEEKIFYLLHAIKERLSVRELERQLNAAVYERTMLSDKSVSTVLAQIPQGVFKDPYIFEFLDLPDVHSEKDFEQALIKNLQKFILEIGKGFAYMGHQFRLQVGNKDYYTDLLFYHRDLQCLVLFELKIEEFPPEFLGKLDFYLEALDRDVKRPHENHSIGVLLCKGKDTEVVEYAMARNLSKAMIAHSTKLSLIEKKNPLPPQILHSVGQKPALPKKKWIKSCLSPLPQKKKKKKIGPGAQKNFLFSGGFFFEKTPKFSGEIPIFFFSGGEKKTTKSPRGGFFEGFLFSPPPSKKKNSSSKKLKINMLEGGFL